MYENLLPHKYIWRHIHLAHNLNTLMVALLIYLFIVDNLDVIHHYHIQFVNNMTD